MVTEEFFVQPLASVTVTVIVPVASPVAVCVVCPSLQKNEYPATPPVADAVAVPLLPPLQLTSVFENEIEIAEGCETVAVAVFVQELASVTVTVYVPAQTLDLFAPLPIPPLQLYE